MTAAVELPVIDTDALSRAIRAAAVRPSKRRLLVTNFRGSEQEPDLTEPANCDGLGRIRHFRRQTSAGWPPNPLPIDPAARFLGVESSTLLRLRCSRTPSVTGGAGTASSRSTSSPRTQVIPARSAQTSWSICICTRWAGRRSST